MSEVNTRKTVVEHFRNLGVHCQRIEDALQAGIPDLNMCYAGREAWVEFKYVEELPKRLTTLVRVGLRSEQALWLKTRHTAGGIVGVLTKVEPREWYLHTAHFDALFRGVLLVDLISTARLHWTGDFKSRATDVLRVLCGCV